MVKEGRAVNGAFDAGIYSLDRRKEYRFSQQFFSAGFVKPADHTTPHHLF